VLAVCNHSANRIVERFRVVDSTANPHIRGGNNPFVDERSNDAMNNPKLSSHVSSGKEFPGLDAGMTLEN